MDRTHRLTLLGAILAIAACAKAVGETTDEQGTQANGGSATGGAGTGAAGPMTSPGPGPMTGNGAGGTGGTVMGCGDGVMQAGEGCDDGNQQNDDACPDDAANGGTCQPATCGDGFVWSTDGGSEGCDDGNGSNHDDCPDGIDGTCVAASCTDGFLHNLESGTEEATDCGGSCPACPFGLILSEVAVTPTASELIEIHNPTPSDIPLGQIYLADYATYYLITQGTGAPGSSDFRVGFPAGASIPAGGHIVISTQSATEFSNTFGFAPDFDFAPGDALAPAMVGEIDAAASLSNSDEMLVMFRWDGVTDLVTDLDYVVWGDTSDAMDKSGITVGASTYVAETAAASQSPAMAPTSGMSVARCIHTEGAETAVGGNGVAGADETSEDHANTWDALSPTPGTFNNCPVVAAVSKDSATLLHLDRATFAELDTAPITSSVAFDSVVSLARDPISGETYCVLNDSFNLRYLAHLNTATGEAEVRGNFGTSLVASIAFDDSGTLYGMVGDGDFVGSDQLGTVNTTTGALSVVFSDSHGDSGEVLAFNTADGDLYRFSGWGLPTMFRIDLVGLTATDVGFSAGTPSEATGGFWDPDAGYFVIWDLNQNTFSVAPDGTVASLALVPTERFGAAIIQ